MKLVLLPAQAAIDAPQRGRLMGAAAARFTTLAWTSVVVLVVTGLLKTPDGRLMDFGSRFGTALAVKHLLIVAMISIGTLYFLVPRLWGRRAMHSTQLVNLHFWIAPSASCSTSRRCGSRA